MVEFLPSETTRTDVAGRGFRFAVQSAGREVARAYLYVLPNDLHREPFGLLEDVFVAEDVRGKGFGTALLKKVIGEAKRAGCYKIIATSRYSRPEAHALYERLGFRNYGIEFRMDF